jgi:hypothetical protein
MQSQCLVMVTFTELPGLPSVPSDHLVAFTDQLRLAAAAYLARSTGSSRYHTESDLRCYLAWCAERGLDPLAARRPHLELYIRWMQGVRRFKPSTVSRRFSVAAGFYRTCVIDGLLEHSPAEHVRRPRNGLAACPAHDVAFDTGMLTVNGGLRTHLASPLANAIQNDPLARLYYGRPPLREVILLPDGAKPRPQVP